MGGGAIPYSVELTNNYPSVSIPSIVYRFNAPSNSCQFANPFIQYWKGKGTKCHFKELFDLKLYMPSMLIGLMACSFVVHADSEKC